MNYALLGDIHSSKEELEKVLLDIFSQSPKAIKVGTGDLFECTISKRNMTGKMYNNLEDVMLIPEGFDELLSFRSVKGNQEERILMLTETANPLRDKLAEMPETYSIGDAEIMHGHQWEWRGNPWTVQHVNYNAPIVFYGHSHRSSLRIDDNEVEIVFGVPYEVNGRKVLVNVGSVVGNCEWLLYDTNAKTVTFMKAK